MATTKDIVIKLTKDELTIMQYIMDMMEYEGDPLKDTYELGDEEPADPYAVLKTLMKKVSKLKWETK